jgi:hypothetical protein
MDVEVSMMSSHLVLPHVGHLKEVFHMFAYLKAHHNTEWCSTDTCGVRP